MSMQNVVILAVAVLLVAWKTGWLGMAWSRIRGMATVPASTPGATNLDDVPTEALIKTIAARRAHAKVAAAEALKAKALLDAVHTVLDGDETPSPKG